MWNKRTNSVERGKTKARVKIICRLQNYFILFNIRIELQANTGSRRVMSSLGVSRIGNNLLISRDLLITGSCKRHPGCVDRSPTPQIEILSRFYSSIAFFFRNKTKTKTTNRKETKQQTKRKGINNFAASSLSLHYNYFLFLNDNFLS